jgi:hypothetical protein
VIGHAFGAFHTYDQRRYCLICNPREEKTMSEAARTTSIRNHEGIQSQYAEVTSA